MPQNRVCGERSQICQIFLLNMCCFICGFVFWMQFRNCICINSSIRGHLFVCSDCLFSQSFVPLLPMYLKIKKKNTWIQKNNYSPSTHWCNLVSFLRWAHALLFSRYRDNVGILYHVLGSLSSLTVSKDTHFIYARGGNA